MKLGLKVEQSAAERLPMIDDEANFIQIIEHLDNDTVRVHNVVPEDSHIGDDDDPLTTIVVKGYKDVSM